METVKLIIPKMKSTHCQMTVENTVKSIGGTVRSLTSAEAEIWLSNGLTKKDIVSAIEKAGYVVVND